MDKNTGIGLLLMADPILIVALIAVFVLLFALMEQTFCNRLNLKSPLARMRVGVMIRELERFVHLVGSDLKLED